MDRKLNEARQKPTSDVS